MNFSPQVQAILAKYRLVDAAGAIRQTTLEGEKKPGPILDPSVLNKFLQLDTSKSKRLFDWMLFAAGGGAPALSESEAALNLSHDLLIENWMNGKDSDEREIPPMTRAKADANWDKVKEIYRNEYFFADEDLAKDPQYRVFGFFRQWPGRDGVYGKVENAVNLFKAIVGNPKLLAEYNRTNPKEPFQTTLWGADNKPRYGTADELLTVCQNFKATFARRKAERDVVLIGKGQDNTYVRGRNETLYEDDLVRVIIPATAAASVAHGFGNWCISNKSRWDEYFKTRNKSSLNWGGYLERGPFAFWLFKPKVKDDDTLQKLAGHISCNSGKQWPEMIEFWDGANQRANTYQSIVQRLTAADPRLNAAFTRSLEAVHAWFKQFKPGDVEQYPNLENLACLLVADLLS